MSNFDKLKERFDAVGALIQVGDGGLVRITYKNEYSNSYQWGKSQLRGIAVSRDEAFLDGDWIQLEVELKKDI